MITQEEFQEWKRHPVSKALFASMAERLNDAVEILIAGEDQLQRGFIQAYKEILAVQLEDVQGDS